MDLSRVTVSYEEWMDGITIREVYMKHIRWCHCEGPRPYYWFEGARICEECEGFIDEPKDMEDV